MLGFSGFIPDWSEQSPPSGSFRSIFKWGDPRRFKHPNRRLYAMLKEILGLSDDDFRHRQNEGLEQVRTEHEVNLGPEHIRMFVEISGQENVAIDQYSRVKYSHGKTMEEILKLRAGMIEHVSDVVISPRSRQEIEQIVGYCDLHRIPIYVYGGGSSVNMGFQPQRGGIVLAMHKHINHLINIDEQNQTATVEAGMMGPAFERLLNDAKKTMGLSRAYTCGHFPQSFEYSTVGGWIAALGSGQQSSYYGDACDLVLAQEYITPSGCLRTRDYPATATGPKVNDILLGSEGAFGVLVEATMKIFRFMPENSQRFAFIFPTWEATVDAAREISQGEFGMPSVFRISDPEETDVALKLYGVDFALVEAALRLRGLQPMQRCLFIGQADGELGFARNIKDNVKRICRKYGAMYISGYPVKKWEHGRFTDAYLREDLNDFGIVIDTLETSVTWSSLHRVHRAVREYIKARPHTVCMTHASHFYPQGTNLYFIFIGKMRDIEEYRQFQSGIIDAIEVNGGSLSHHHGVGKMLAPWMERHLGKPQMEVLRAIKRHFDPHNIMNPGGTLGL
jgi:alkyldihydroxyacetonephosphate synthase